MSYSLRATDREIQDWVEQRFHFRPELAWIAHCKVLCGLSAQDIRTIQAVKLAPCPPEKQASIIKALRYFKK